MYKNHKNQRQQQQQFQNNDNLRSPRGTESKQSFIYQKQDRKISRRNNAMEQQQKHSNKINKSAQFSENLEKQNIGTLRSLKV